MREIQKQEETQHTRVDKEATEPNIYAIESPKHPHNGSRQKVVSVKIISLNYFLSRVILRMLGTDSQLNTSKCLSFSRSMRESQKKEETQHTRVDKEATEPNIINREFQASYE
jgi:hypothetical protein